MAATSGGGAHAARPEAVHSGMKLMRTAALAGIAKRLYDESRKPENQARVKAAVARLRERPERRGHTGS